MYLRNCIHLRAGIERLTAGAAAAQERLRPGWRVLFTAFMLLILSLPLLAQGEHAGGEANLRLPDLNSATFLGGIGGRSLLMGGILVSALGFLFGLAIFVRLRNMPVHPAMREVSELIYETCKTYLVT